MVSEEFRATWSPRLLSVIRILTGLMFMQHGLSKYFGFPMPYPNPNFQVWSMLGVAGIIEIVAGFLIAIGFGSRCAAFIASGEMAVGYFMYHAPRGFFPLVNGGEGAIFYCFVFLYLALAGPGPWSLSRSLSR
jgi:putative oxidoreductase